MSELNSFDLQTTSHQSACRLLLLSELLRKEDCITEKDENLREELNFFVLEDLARVADVLATV